MRSIIAAAAQGVRALEYRRFVRRCKQVRASQEVSLAQLVANLRDTEVGRRLGVARLSSLARLQAHVPLSSYPDYQGDVDAILAGKPDVMVPGTPVFIAETSGSTGERKLFPVTPFYLREFKPASAVFLYGLYRDHPAVRDGKILFFAGRMSGEVSPAGVPIGTGSGYNYQKMPSFIQRAFACPYAALDVADLEANYYAIALTALRSEVAALFTISTLPVALLGWCMRDHADALLRDIREGTLNPPGPMTSKERAALQPFLRADPARARELEKRASATGQLTPRSAWPSLGLICSFLHASAGAYLDEIAALCGDVPVRAMMYSATEGTFAIPMEDGDPGGILAVGTHVFEFIPVDDEWNKAGDPVLAHQLDKGQRYSLVVSCGAGLWRYQMHDIVECTGFFHQAPRIAFVQKESSVLSLAEDRTTESQVRAAIDALRAQGMAIGRHCFGPGVGAPVRYALAVDGPGLDSAALEHAFDRALQAKNSRYARAREQDSLAPAEVHIIPPGRFARFDAERASRGVGAQDKPLEFSKSPNFREQLG